MKVKLIIILLLCAAFLLVYFIYPREQKIDNHLSNNELLLLSDRSLISGTINEKIFEFELVNSNASRTLGLSNRDAIGSDGMLFVFNKKASQSIWMKDMNFNLDLIWLSDGEIIGFNLAVPKPEPDQNLSELPIYQPVLAANAVLETQAGFVKQHALEIGDSFAFFSLP